MTLLNHLDTLESAGLVRLAQAQPDIEYLFRHTLVQEAAYASLVRRDRQQLHRSVGETIERLYPDRLTQPDLAPLLARHFDLAGDHLRALKYYAQAGDQAAQHYANLEAIAYYTRAIKLGQQLETAAPLDQAQLIHLFTSLGRAQQLIGHHPDALHTYQDFAQLAQQRQDKVMELAAVMERVTLHATPTPLQDPALSHQLLKQALELAHLVGDRPAEAKINWSLMMTELFGGETSEARRYGEQSLAIAREQQLEDQLPFTLNDLAFTYIFLGQMDLGRAALDEVRELWRAKHNLPMLSDCLANSALAEFYLGHFMPAVQFAREGINISESIHNAWGQSHNYGMLGYMLQEQGQLSEALDAWINSVTYGEQSGLIATRVGTRADLGQLYHLLGQDSLALDQVNQAHAYSETIMPIWKAWSASVLARLYLSQHRLAEAQILIDTYCPGNLQQHFARLLRSGAVNVGIVRGELAYARQHYQTVIEFMDEMAAILKSIGAGTFLDDAWLLKGRSLQQLNRLTEAQSVLQQARLAAESIGSHRILWRTLTALSEVETKLGNLNEADELRQYARREINYLAGNIEPLQFRASFLNQSDIQAVLKNS